MHQYGAHIFHTADEAVWAYVQRFCRMKPFINSPIANYKGELYNLLFNMNTFTAYEACAHPRRHSATFGSRSSAPA